MNSRPTRLPHARAALRRTSLLFLATATLLGSCAESPTEPRIGPPAALQIVSGSGQTAVVGTTLSVPFEVEVLDSRGRAVPLALVRWTVSVGAGDVTPDSSYTNAAGTARTTLSAGTIPGEIRVRANIAGLSSVEFSATAIRRPVAQLVAVSGSAQYAQVGTSLPTPLTVMATDMYGDPLTDIPISFSATNGVLTPSSVLTNAEGLATAAWTMPIRAGSLTATARVLSAPHVSPAQFYVEATPIPVDTILILSGAGQSGSIGTTLAAPITVRVLDLTGAPIPQHLVVFYPNHGSATPQSTVTNAAGEASTTWELGNAVGPQTLTVSSQYGSGGVFTVLNATATAGPPTRVTLVSGGDQSGGRGESLPFPIVIRARDALENVVVGATITFTAGAGQGSFSPSTVTTDSLGRASTSWTLGSSLGAMTATASAAGGGTLTLTAQATPPLFTLDYDVVDAEYHAGTNRLITVTSVPARIHIINPDTRAALSVALPIPATAVAISPDGGTAAVGHDGYVSQVNLNTGTVMQTIPIGIAVGNLVLTANGFVYSIPRYDQARDLTGLNLASGVFRTTTSPYQGSGLRLHPSGAFLYVNGSGVLEKYDIRDDTAALVARRPTSFGQGLGYELWMSADGARLFGQNGGVFTTSTNAATDMTYLTRLFDVGIVIAIAHSPATQRVAAFEAAEWNQPPQAGFRVFSQEFLSPLGTVPLPRFPVPSGGMVRGDGRFAFFSASGALHILLQAQETSGLSSRWALTTYAAADLP